MPPQKGNENEQEIEPIPLQNVAVEANIVDMIAEVTISQVYKNIEECTIEALYKFPIDEAAAICGFEAEIDGQRKVKGIGDSVSHNLVESIARAGKGYAQFVTNDERMDKKVIGMLKNALNPPISKDYNITWTEVNLLDEKELDMTPIEVDKPTISFMSDDNIEPPPPPSPPPSDIFTDIKVQQVPYIIPPIYSGVRFIVYCILEKNIEPCKVITLKATSQDGPMKLDIPLDPVTLQGSKIHRLAARKLIQDLNDKRSFIHKHPKNANKNIPDSLVKEHIVKLVKTFNLVSKYTSFIAIDRRNNEILSESQIIPQIRKVPQINNSYRKKRRKEDASQENSLSFINYNNECEMCYEKAEKAFKKMIGNNEKEKIIIEKAEELIKNWVNNSD
ncbi:hypothetical protein RhiirA4_495343 [Rhizophagus irregularis]|uniref:VIT domain-containing protein n=1 Tax=Rhizophagus irregularis TaxID=588596 RepID=A0A2I1GZA5_9GLOM|nr:hypothetical protein RhiirA4_495343 [Rhizophagus irregularis]